MFRFFNHTRKPVFSVLASQASRLIHYKALNHLDDGTFIAELRNNRSPNESLDKYKQRSMAEFKGHLKPNYYYIYVDRSTLVNGTLNPGHIAFFATNSDGGIIERSCMSLRNSTVIGGETLYFTLKHEKPKTLRRNSVWNIRFLTIEQELDEFLFSKAEEHKPLELERCRFITAIPQARFPETLEETLMRIDTAKVELKQSKYILADGYLVKLPVDNVKTFVSALNCVTGFYRAVSVTGQDSAPSTQMAKTGFLALLLGQDAKNRLIEGTGLRDRHDEQRNNDDQLQWEPRHGKKSSKP